MTLVTPYCISHHSSSEAVGNFNFEVGGFEVPNGLVARTMYALPYGITLQAQFRCPANVSLCFFDFCVLVSEHMKFSTSWAVLAGSNVRELFVVLMDMLRKIKF